MNMKTNLAHESLITQGEVVNFPGKPEVTMEQKLKEPLVPANVDLRDFAYMPLDVVRFRDSDFAALIDGEAFRAGVLLWCASWHQIPAGSLPADDRVLANLAGFGRYVGEWEKVKESALHGWIQCADGRLYHPVICEKALESWSSKQHHQYVRFSDRMRKANKKLEAENKPPVEIPDQYLWISAGCPKDWSKNSTDFPMENYRNSNGKDGISGGNPKNSDLNIREYNIRNINNTHTNTQEENPAARVWNPNLETLSSILKTTKYSHRVSEILSMEDFQFHLGNFNTYHEKNFQLTDNQRHRKFAQWVIQEFEKALEKAERKNKQSSGYTRSEKQNSSLNVNTAWNNQPAQQHTPVDPTFHIPEDFI